MMPYDQQNEFVNYLGGFTSIDEVWEKYPEGGHEGDYISINGEQISWNKYTQSWGGAPDGESTRQLHEILGSLVVESNLSVGGTIRAKRIVQPDKGLWPTIEALRKSIPSPEKGYWAAVGNSFPAELWVCEEEGVWSNSGTTYEGGKVNLSDYASSENILSEEEYEAIANKEDRFYFTYEE